MTPEATAGTDETSLHLTYTLPLRDWTRATRAMTFGSRAIFRQLVYPALAVIGIALLATNQNLAGVLAIAAGATGSLIILKGVTIGSRRAYKRDPLAGQTFTTVFSPSGVDTSTPITHSSARWERFAQITERAGFLMLYSARNRATIIPLGSLSPEDLTMLRGWIAAARRT